MIRVYIVIDLVQRDDESGGGAERLQPQLPVLGIKQAARVGWVNLADYGLYLPTYITDQQSVHNPG